MISQIKQRFIRNLMSGNFFRNIWLFIIKPIRMVVKKVDLYLQSTTRRHFGRDIPVQNNKILFINFQGSYSCNQKAIAEEIIRQKLPYELVFVVLSENLKKPEVMREFPRQVKLVIRGTYNFYEEAASSKIWVDNSINMEYTNALKKEDQVVIQTWHGSLGLKKMTKDSVMDKKWVKKAIKYGQKTEYCISNSKFETEMVYKNNYWENSQILEYGHPRNDILFHKDSEEYNNVIKKVKEYFNIDIDKKICLYAPTFREDKTLDYYNIDYKKLKESLKKRFGGDWVILERLHFKLRKINSIVDYEDEVINASNYVDMQDLIVASDIGITDYSSWICDFVLTGKPGFLYAEDIKNYESERGLFYPLSQTPFPVAENNDKLNDNILNFDMKEYERKKEEFLKLRGCIEDGNASKRVVEKIKEIIENSEKA